jgi:hypothetical protein
MATYVPNNWVVLKITLEDQSIYKILAGWSGSYLDGSSWKLNSGITHVEETDTHYNFYGYSGSCYKCNKESYGLHNSTINLYESMKQRFADNVMMLDEDTNWMNMNWSENVAV